ncbi:unknown protein [Waddlia chondrophila 2032/99]|uniref:Uncharacterized protein n=1 Tax=Waddlia chondrophila 2032/99 TaxID=765953 RepID=F8LD19_9BACT|nr:unknown protein [Waddlia chondrophila 2032/99]
MLACFKDVLFIVFDCRLEVSLAKQVKGAVRLSLNQRAEEQQTSSR